MRRKARVFTSSVALLLVGLPALAASSDRIPGLAGVWLDTKWGKPFLIVNQNTIQVADCKYRHYEVLNSDDSAGPDRTTSRTYYIKATEPILGTHHAPIRDLDCAVAAPTFLRLRVEPVDPPGVLRFTDCKSFQDFEALRQGSLNVACSFLTLALLHQ